MPTDMDIFHQAIRLLENDKHLVLCTVVEKKGSGPRGIGAKMLVTEDEVAFGTIGGGNVERALVDECLKALKEGKSKTVTFNLSKSAKEGTVATGMICGGELTVLLDLLKPTPSLVIVGAGHISLPLAKLANIAGFKVTVVDDERSLASKERFPMAELIIGDFNQVFGTLSLSQNDFVVIVHGEPEHDYVALKNLLPKETGYVGLLGSRIKAALLTERLRTDSIDEKRIRALHAPLGLDIGAETPEEIAISILAEIVRCKRQTEQKEIGS